MRLVLGMPERVFVRTPEEPKPFFVDFSSPLLVQMWAGMARGLVRNRVTWSVDPAANRAMEQVAR
jgi:hypothetical protein